MLGPSEKNKHWLNKTPNKVHEGLLTDAKNFIMEIIFLLDRFYAVFKVYRVGVVLKFKSLKFSGFFFHSSISCVLNCEDRLCIFSSAVPIYEIHIIFINDFNLINSLTFYIH